MKNLIKGSLLLAVIGLLAPAALAQQRKIFAVLNVDDIGGSYVYPTGKAVSFYDVSDLSGTDVLNETPLFSVWVGYEQELLPAVPGTYNNHEDPQTITVNPANGNVYMIGFDSGSVGVADAYGDNEGDLDVYRIDYQEILADWEASGSPMGQMYAPTYASYYGQPGLGSAGFETDHPAHAGTTRFIDNAIIKVGEVARNQNDGPTTYPMDVDFVDPSRLLLKDGDTGNGADDWRVHDYGLRVIERQSSVSASTFQITDTDPVAGTQTVTFQEGGYTGQSAEAWESRVLGIFNLPSSGGGLDYNSTAGDFSGRSEVEDIQYYRDADTGVEGVWVAESDAGGDDIAFYQIDDWSGQATGNGFKEMLTSLPPLPQAFSLDNDPNNPTANDGSVDWINVGFDGTLVIGESGYFDVPQHEPQVITRLVDSYDSPDSDGSGENEIDFGAWGGAGPMAPTVDDDTAVVDGRFVAFDKHSGHAYFLDIDSDGTYTNDLYVLDVYTGALVYQEVDAVDAFIEEHGMAIFLRGDVNDDGVLDIADAQLLAAAEAGGDALLNEWYDLTGDLIVNEDDINEFAVGIIEAIAGDANLDGVTDDADYTLWADNYGATASDWIHGDFNLDGAVDDADYTIWADNYGAVKITPEPTSLALIGLAGLGLLRRRR